MRAAAHPALHSAFGVAFCNNAGALDGGGRNLNSLGIVECGLSGHSQPPRVTFDACAGRPAVSFVTEHIPYRLRCQRVGLGRPAHRQDAAGVAFLQDRVGAVAALGVSHSPPQGRAVAYHGGNAQLAVLLGVHSRWLDEQDAAGVTVNDVAHAVVHQLGFANLRGGHHHKMVNFRVAKGVHRFSQVWGAARAPCADLGAGFTGQLAVLFSPLGNGHILRGLHAVQHLGKYGVQPLDVGGATHRHPRGLSRPKPSAPAPVPHRLSGHSGTAPAGRTGY